MLQLMLSLLAREVVQREFRIVVALEGKLHNHYGKNKEEAIVENANIEQRCTF